MIGRRMIAAGVVAGAVAVGGVTGALVGIPGLSGATTTSGSSGSTTTNPSGEAPYGGHDFKGFFGLRMGDDGVIAAAAKALNLSTDELLQKLSDGKTTIADVAQQQHVDVQTVIDAMEAVAKQNIEDLVNHPLPTPPDYFGGPKIGPGFGFVFGLPGLHGALDTVAHALGITTDELRSDLRNGQSIADIAKAKNVDLGTIVDALVKDAQSKLDQAVKDEKLSQEQADHIAANLKQRITDLLEHGFPKDLGPRPGFRMPGGPDGNGWHWPWAGGPEGQSPSSSTPT
jgi:hypothetical protein